jgi:Putative Actinobacterial Holin-X, holin superfamily III
MPNEPDNRSLGELMAELSRDMGTLVRQELELATTELTSKAREAGGHVAVAATGGALLHAGLLVILAALVTGLAQLGIPPWLAATTVAVLTMAVGYVLISKGVAGLRRTRFAPRHTIETLKENAKWTTSQRV